MARITESVRPAAVMHKRFSFSFFNIGRIRSEGFSSFIFKVYRIGRFFPVVHFILLSLPRFYTPCPAGERDFHLESFTFSHFHANSFVFISIS